jgi:Family of unknown function (DUF5686)/CarboxypepD_reg-like domain
MRTLLLIITIGVSSAGFGQSYKIYGNITNSKNEPLAFASVQVKEIKQGTLTKEDGGYLFELDEGKYDLVISLVGYKTQAITVVLQKPYQLNIIMEADVSSLAEVVVKGRSRDRAEEYIRNVIRNKDAIENAAGPYSCKVYIKALQQDSMDFKKSKKPESDSLQKVKLANAELNQMAMAEIVLRLDHASVKSIKEERIGVTKRGNTQGLFFLSTTQGDFSFYNNLINIPSISQTQFLSPFSYSGLLAYRFKTIKTEVVNGKKIYTIGVKPRQLSNATVEGEVTIAEGSWAVMHTKLRLPKYHLAEYDFFEVEQQYGFINNNAWMITRQQFTYNAVAGKKRSSGSTVATYSEFELNKVFPKKYFGTELSSATLDTYKRDSVFWQQNRTEPLTEKEIRFIHYKDSAYRATHTNAYLDSLDRVNNRVTWKTIFIKGQNFNDHVKRRSWYIPPLPALYQPFQFGGTRIQTSFNYFKTWESRKNIFLYSDISYGLRNRDVNGNIRISRLYNPFKRAYYYVRLQKNFDFIFSGDAWINMINRNNFYLNQVAGLGHSFEITNGLYLYADGDIAFRRSLSNFKTGNLIDSTLGDFLDSNRAVAFDPYNAFYGSLRLEYTPHQRYIREPREKVILGSAWPTFYISWKKGVPGIFNSAINFDYLEFGLKQSIKIGTLGTSSYTVKTGSFINKKDLRLVDYKRERRGDPIFFSNPNEAFQSLDSTFPVFKRFYEGHYIHEFNGALLNKIPLLKKLGLREIAGAGFLLAPERNNLRYVEAFTGIERVFKYPFNRLGKFKLGVYMSASAANQFKNPVQFKVGLTTWDKRNGKWL